MGAEFEGRLEHWLERAAAVRPAVDSLVGEAQALIAELRKQRDHFRAMCEHE